MKRREFIAGLAGAAAWSIASRAQQPTGIRRIGVLSALAADDPESMGRIATFLQGLQELGWSVGRNVRIDYRWGASDADRTRRSAAELVALVPDVILANGGSIMAPLQQVTRTVPIVFAAVADPVGSGFVASLARPGGNATGFANFEYGISGKWLELLKQLTPAVKRVAVLRDPTGARRSGRAGPPPPVAQRAAWRYCRDHGCAAARRAARERHAGSDAPVRRGVGGESGTSGLRILGDMGGVDGGGGWSPLAVASSVPSRPWHQG